MNNDSMSPISGAISLLIHILLVAMLSFFVQSKPPRKVALLTDVTLLDRGNQAGTPGLEQKVVGTEQVQKKMPEASKKPKANPAVKKDADAQKTDIKELLKKLEEQKSKLDMGVSRDTLRKNASEDSSEENGAIDGGEVAAGGQPEVSGAIASRRYRPIDWKFPENLPEETELMVQITVMPSGVIKSVKLARASGYPELDRQALSQARTLLFDALPQEYVQEEQTGYLLFKFGAKR